MRVFSMQHTVPWLVWGFFKIITPFIDPVTREKLKFNEDMKQYVPAEQLWSGDWGGDLDFEYDHATYWPALNETCRVKREQKEARWVAAGKAVGELEDYLVGGTDVSVTGFQYHEGGAAQSVEGAADVSVLEEKLAETKLEDVKTNNEAAVAAA